MKYIIQSFAVLAALITFNSCTAYVEPGPSTLTTTTETHTTTSDPYMPGASVTTQKTTTTRYGDD